MKQKIEIVRSTVDENGKTRCEVVKTFKNEPDAMAFYTSPRNARLMNNCVMFRYAGGEKQVWDDGASTWTGGEA